MTMTQWWAPTVVRISGDSTVRGQLLHTIEGSLICDFPERMILIANHQIYTDWLYLWWIGYAAGMHGRIYVVLKESLKRIPVIGWGMQFSQFIFLKRKWEQDKPRMAAHLQKFNKPGQPMWLMMFPEGTNLADSTREASKQWAAKNGIHDMQHTLLPRSTGLQFMLQELHETVEYIYDCTIAYEGVPRSEFAQDIFTVGASYFGGRPPKSVNMYWRRFRISTIPFDDPKNFELWLRQRWVEKDKFIEDYLRTGRFPADNGTSKDNKGQFITGAGHIEADIKPKYWYEFLQVFAPIGLFALVLYMFYGALPAEVLNKIKSIDQRTVLKKIAAYQRGEIKIPDQKSLRTQAAKALEDQQKTGGSKLRNAALAHGVVTLNGVPQKDFPAKGLEDQPAKKTAKPKKLPGKQTPSTKVTSKPRSTASKPKASSKRASLTAPSKPQGVTLNGVPLKDFKEKGLEETASVGEVSSSDQKPNVLSAAQTKTSTARNLSSTASSTQKPSANTLGSRNPPLQAHRSRVSGNTNGQSPSVSKTKVQKKGKEARTAAKPTSNLRTESKKPEVKSKSNAISRQLIEKPTESHVAATDTSLRGPENKRAEVRRMQKRIKLRQGKQQPKRKTRRGLESSASMS